MQKVTGQPIKFSDAEILRQNLISIKGDPAITSILAKGDNTPLEIFLQNINCGFVFDKKSLQHLIEKLNTVTGSDSGLVMMMCASDPVDRERANKPTLAIFPCLIDRDKDEYHIMLDSQNPGETPGTQHPGIVRFDGPKIEKKGPIGFLSI